MSVTRSRFFRAAGTAGAFAVVRYPAGAAEFTYKLANDLPAEHPLAVHANRAADDIKKDSGGRLEIRVFANSALGGQAQVYTQAREGAIEFTLLGDDLLAGVVPAYSISRVPFAFASYKDAWSTMDGPLGSYLRGAVTKAGVNLYRFQNVWGSGMRQMMNSLRPVNTPEDLRGLKVRIPQSPMPVAFFKAFGASPTVIGSNELYAGLQNHLVDGLDYPLGAAAAFRLYEVQKYVSLTNHVWTGYTLHVNSEAWARLPKDVRDIAERRLNAAAVAERNEVARDDAALAADFARRGVQVSRPPVAPFKAVVQNAGLYAQWRDMLGAEPWSYLEKAGQKLS